MKDAQARTRVVGAAAALAMALVLTACGGGSDEPPKNDRTDPAPTSETATEEPQPTGTFKVTGAESLDGALKDIVCVPSDDGVQVTAAFGAGDSGRLTVVSGSAPTGSDRRDSFKLNDDDLGTYSRISGATSTAKLPFDIVDNGPKVTGSVVLVDIQDIAEPDLDDQKQVTLTVDIDCGS